MKGNDLNYLIQVKVISQHLEANNLSQMREIPGIKPSDFLEVYGDSFVSGFVEGGEFTALLSIRVKSKDHLPAAKIALESDFGDLESGNKPAGQLHVQDLIDEDKIAVHIRYFWLSKMLSLLKYPSVAWIGDTTQDPADIEWTVEAVRQAAIDFPEKVTSCPQRTQ